MSIIYQLSKEELRQTLSEIVSETLSQHIKTTALSREKLPDKIMDVDEVSEITGLKKSVIYKMTHKRELPFKKYGKRLVFSRRELQNWVDAKTTIPDTLNTVEKSLAEAASTKLRRAQ